MSPLQYGNITGGSGTSFSDPIDAQPMTGFFVRTGAILNCIQAIYGNNTRGTLHGDDNGGTARTVHFDDDEYLVRVTVRLLSSPSALMTQPTFITNKRTYGPLDGMSDGEVVELHAQPNERIDGFCGRIAVPGPSWRNWVCALGIGVRNAIADAPTATNIEVTGHPQGGSYAEWVQLRNISSRPVELLGATIRVPSAQRKVVEIGKNVFTFAASTVLAPGESVKVASLARPGESTLDFGSELPLFYEQGKDVVELHGADNSLIISVNIDK